MDLIRCFVIEHSQGSVVNQVFYFFYLSGTDLFKLSLFWKEHSDQPDPVFYRPFFL